MALAPLDRTGELEESLSAVRALLLDVAACFTAESGSLSTRELANTVAAVEDVSKIVEYLQAAGAHAVERADIAANGETAAGPGALADAPDAAGAAGWADPAAAIGAGGASDHPVGLEPAGSGVSGQKQQRRRKTEFRNNAEYLRSRLGISIIEARRRLRVGKAVTAPVRFDGEPGTPALPVLAEAMAARGDQRRRRGPGHRFARPGRPRRARCRDVGGDGSVFGPAGRRDRRGHAGDGREDLGNSGRPGRCRTLG